MAIDPNFARSIIATTLAAPEEKPQTVSGLINNNPALQQYLQKKAAIQATYDATGEWAIDPERLDLAERVAANNLRMQMLGLKHPEERDSKLFQHYGNMTTGMHQVIDGMQNHPDPKVNNIQRRRDLREMRQNYNAVVPGKSHLLSTLAQQEEMLSR